MLEQQLSRAPSSLSPLPGRLCHIESRKVEGENLGFTIYGSRNRPGELKILDVKKRSPAEFGGLCHDEYLAEVCGQSVHEMTYPEVIDLIRAKKVEGQLELRVIDNIDALNLFRSRIDSEIMRF